MPMLYRLGHPALFFLAALLATSCLGRSAAAATAKTANFHVVARDARTAEVVAVRAEELRRELALDWLGRALPDWEQPCVVHVNSPHERLSGETSYSIADGVISRWRMNLHGDRDRILATLLPHEIVHTVLASHFKREVPRWADEGAALLAEDEADQLRLWKSEGPRLRADDVPALTEFLTMNEYPEDREALRRFYVQGVGLTEFLISAGKARFLGFVEAGMTAGWTPAIARYYGFTGTDDLDRAWRGWLQEGRPAIALGPEESLASWSSSRRSGDGRLATTSARAGAEGL